MAYIVQRKDRFYVVDYDGIDPITGKERRRWRLAGHTRADAESVVERLDAKRAQSPVRVSSASLGGFLTDVWLPRKRSQVRATTACRYAWIVDRYVLPRLGAVSLRSFAPITSTTSTTTCSRAAASTEDHSHRRRCMRRTSSCATRSISRYDAISSIATSHSLSTPRGVEAAAP